AAIAAVVVAGAASDSAGARRGAPLRDHGSSGAPPAAPDEVAARRDQGPGPQAAPRSAEAVRGAAGRREGRSRGSRQGQGNLAPVGRIDLPARSEERRVGKEGRVLASREVVKDLGMRIWTAICSA